MRNVICFSELEDKPKKGSKKGNDKTDKRFIFLKRVFKDVESIPETSNEIALLFAQCVRSVVIRDEYKVTDTEAMYLAGLQCAGVFGPYDDSYRITRYKQSSNFFPERIVRYIPDERSREQMLITQHKKFQSLSMAAGQRAYILKCLKDLPLFGSAIYEKVTYRGFVNPDCEVKLAVNRNGICLLNSLTSDKFLQYPFDRLASISVDLDNDLILIKLVDSAADSDEMLCELISEFKEDIVQVIKCYCPRLTTVEKKKDLLGMKNQNEERSMKRMRQDVSSARDILFKLDEQVLNTSQQQPVESEQPQTMKRKSKKADQDDKKHSMALLDFSAQSPYWVFTKKPLQQSLLHHEDGECTGLALKIFNTILFFSKHISEKSSHPLLPNADRKQPVATIQEIFRQFDKHPSLVDEVYMQLCKQVTDQPLDSKDLDVWDIFGALTNYRVPENAQVRSYVESTLRLSSVGVSKVSQYASYCRRCLQKVATFPQRQRVPSKIEIESTSKCEQVKASIYFPGGQCRVVQFDSWATSQQVIQATIERIYLAGSVNVYSLFERLSHGSSLVKEVPITPDDNICDRLGYTSS